MGITKTDILNHCCQLVNDREAVLNAALSDANTSLLEDTKSSAGDKYETSREMIQQDITRYQQQLKLAEQDKAILDKIANSNTEIRVSSQGALLKTKLGYFFVSISVGKVKLNDIDVYIMSAQSPIGMSLLGLKKGDFFNFQNQSIQIEDIL